MFTGSVLLNTFSNLTMQGEVVLVCDYARFANGETLRQADERAVEHAKAIEKQGWLATFDDVWYTEQTRELLKGVGQPNRERCRDLLQVAKCIATEWHADHGQYPFDDPTQPIANAFPPPGPLQVSGKDGVVKFPEPIVQLAARFRSRFHDWPRVLNGKLFVIHDDRPAALENVDALFSWFAERSLDEWDNARGCVSRKQFYEYLRRTAPRYDAVEVAPHWPSLPGVFYINRAPEHPIERILGNIKRADGAALAKLLAFFSPETEHDRELILAYFLTCFSGIRPGTRPAFLIEASGRGQGKTSLAIAAAMLTNADDGLLMVSDIQDIDALCTRLLSPGATGKRVVLVDNLKTTRFSSAGLEAMLTSPTISGRALYVGEASRPNTLVLTITSNEPRCSTDIASRVVTIRLAEPEYQKGWMSQLVAHVKQNRWAIISDIIALLQSDGVAMKRYSRWETWENAVLSRVADPDAVQQTIISR